MYVKNLYIENFRSIEKIDVELRPLCAFIGPNNAGKSNILDALDLILGEIFPTIRAFSERDFRNHISNKPIIIRTIFDSPINDDYGNQRIYGLELNLKNPEHLEYFPIDKNNQRIQYTSGTQMRVSSNMREQIPLLHIGIDRRIEAQLRPTKWTLWGRILKVLCNKFEEDKQRVGDFNKKMTEATQLLYIKELQEVTTILESQIKSQTGLPDLSLKFGIMDPLECYKYLRPYLRNVDAGVEFDPQQMGLGTQSAIVVALAEVYRKLVKESAVMLIDEPELYLHTHACRHFYSLLNELAKSGLQVIYTTHNASFLDISDYQKIYLVRKVEDKTKVFEGHKLKLDQKDSKLKLATRFDHSMSEIFFAKIVLLVEGPEDKIACLKAFDLSKIYADKEGVTVACCGGKPGIPFIAKILDALTIPICVLCDSDPGKPTEKQSEIIKQIVGEKDYFELPDKLETALGLDRDLNQIELLEFLDRFNSFDELPQTFKTTARQLVERINWWIESTK